MAADPTLDLDLAAVTDESRHLAATIKPGSALLGRDRGGQRARREAWPPSSSPPPASRCWPSKRGA